MKIVKLISGHKYYYVCIYYSNVIILVIEGAGFSSVTKTLNYSMPQNITHTRVVEPSARKK